MHADFIYEALHFLERKDLEICQLSAKFLNDFIGSSTELPLRYIELAIIEGPSVQLRIEKKYVSDDDDDEYEEAFQRRIANDYEQDLTVEDFHGFVGRLRNVCIGRLILGFAEPDEPVVRYWLASHSHDNFCLMELHQETAGNSIVYELLDDTLRTLKPQQYSTTVDDSFDPEQLLRHADVLSHVFRWESLRRAALCLKVDSFVNGSFVDPPGGSLSIVWADPDEYMKPRLLRYPAQTDVPKPRTDFTDETYPNRKELQCDLYIFDNENSRQRLRVYMWGIVDVDLRDVGDRDVHACALLFSFVAL